MDAAQGRAGWRLVCATVEMVAVAVWVGGLIVIVSAVIPAVFNSFGMEPAGRFLTRVFDGYNRLVFGAALVLVTCLVIRFALRGRGPDGPLWPPSRTELILVAVMMASATVIMFVLMPASVTLQEQAFAITDGAERKAAYEAFFRAHQLVRVLYVVNLGLGVMLIPVKLKRVIRSGG